MDAHGFHPVKMAKGIGCSVTSRREVAAVFFLKSSRYPQKACHIFFIILLCCKKGKNLSKKEREAGENVRENWPPPFSVEFIIDVTSF
jgi:hypothetical protein